MTDHLEPGTRYAAESGFTTAFAMGAIALVVAMGAAALIPGRRAHAAGDRVAQVGRAGRRRDLIVEEPYPVTEQHRDHVRR